MKDNFITSYNKLFKYAKHLLTLIFTNSIFLWIFSSCILTTLVEYISNYYSLQLYSSYYQKDKFILNLLIIMATTSIMFLFKRRFFVFTFVSILWTSFSIANSMLLKMRGTPLTSSDVKIIKSGIAIMDQYLSKTSIILIFGSISILLVLLIFIFIKGPKVKKVNYKLIPIGLIIFAISLVGYLKVMLAKEIVSTNYWDLNNCYISYGFPYSFSNTIINYGVKKPSNYSKKTMDKLYSLLETEDIASTNNDINTYSDMDTIQPNIIMVQLESFFDPTLVEYLNFSNDPIPNFRRLSEEFTSGLLDVAVLGGGTSNTEFEAITGLSIKLFGPGEYPYNTILKSQPVESIAYYLKDHGYTTSAMHNNSGTFYGRHNVFSNLGFDRFISREHMFNVNYTPTGWAKDDVLVDEISDLISSTPESDFIYAISVQGHGAYPETKVLDDSEIQVTVSSDTLNENDINKWQYFTEQMYEMDIFVSDLINSLSEINEPTIVAFYGDHLPSLGLDDDSVSNNNIYQTPFLIWDNINLPKETLNLKTYQLSSYILDKANISGGIISKLHQTQSTSEEYNSLLHLLQYDILYGNNYIYNSKSLYNKTDIQYGFKPLNITDIQKNDDYILIFGEGFTSNSIVYINDEYTDTYLIDNNTLSIPSVKLNEGDKVVVSQRCSDSTILGSSNEYIYK